MNPIEELHEEVQQVVDRMARNDPTMIEANLSCESAAADGAAAVALLQILAARVRCVVCLWLGWRGVCVVLIVCAPLNRRVHQGTMWAPRKLQRWLAL